MIIHFDSDLFHELIVPYRLRRLVRQRSTRLIPIVFVVCRYIDNNNSICPILYKLCPIILALELELWFVLEFKLRLLKFWNSEIRTRKVSNKNCPVLDGIDEKISLEYHDTYYWAYMFCYTNDRSFVAILIKKFESRKISCQDCFY